MGTELERRGFNTTGGEWSARAVTDYPSLVQQIHHDYVDAGAQLHTANTFRTQPQRLGRQWQKATAAAVQLARDAIPLGQKLAASMAPLEDCYRPDLSPPNARAAHRHFAQFLSTLPIDLVLCETFPAVAESLIAAEEARRTGLETWLALTPGPNANLMSTATLVDGAKRAAELGVSCVLINCVAVTRIEPFVRALADTGLRFGVYANTGTVEDGFGWQNDAPQPAQRYAQKALEWVYLGASVIGGCCGTTPAHIEAIRRLLGSSTPANSRVSGP